MCQICGIKDLADRERWPKPLEKHKSDIDFLVTSAHDEYTRFKTQEKSENATTTPAALLEVLRLLATIIEDLENDRADWWSSKEKRDLRRRLEEECDQKKLSQLHKINNESTESIEAMNAKLGGFVKWSLGMNGGIWELQQGDKVAKAAEQE